jgi:hypothetical protein
LLQGLFVVLGERRIGVGTLADYAGVRGVASLACRVTIADERITIHCDAARLGALPIPRGWVATGLERLPASDGVLVNPRGGGMISIRNDLVWPNGRRRCRLAELTVVDGVVTVVIEPMAGGIRYGD